MPETEGARDSLVEQGAVALGDAQPLDAAVAGGTLPFHTVVVGASAGGVETLMRFFDSMPRPRGVHSWSSCTCWRIARACWPR